MENTKFVFTSVINFFKLQSNNSCAYNQTAYYAVDTVSLYRWFQVGVTLITVPQNTSHKLHFVFLKLFLKKDIQQNIICEFINFLISLTTLDNFRQISKTQLKHYVFVCFFFFLFFFFFFVCYFFVVVVVGVVVVFCCFFFFFCFFVLFFFCFFVFFVFVFVFFSE